MATLRHVQQARLIVESKTTALTIHLIKTPSTKERALYDDHSTIETGGSRIDRSIDRPPFFSHLFFLDRGIKRSSIVFVTSTTSNDISMFSRHGAPQQPLPPAAPPHRIGVSLVRRFSGPKGQVRLLCGTTFWSPAHPSICKLSAYNIRIT